MFITEVPLIDSLGSEVSEPDRDITCCILLEIFWKVACHQEWKGTKVRLPLLVFTAIQWDCDCCCSGLMVLGVGNWCGVFPLCLSVLSLTKLVFVFLPKEFSRSHHLQDVTQQQSIQPVLSFCRFRFRRGTEPKGRKYCTDRIILWQAIAQPFRSLTVAYENIPPFLFIQEHFFQMQPNAVCPHAVRCPHFNALSVGLSDRRTLGQLFWALRKITRTKI